MKKLMIMAAVSAATSFAYAEGKWYDQVSAEASLAFDSKFMTYGLVDNDDPILTPSASLTLFDWVNVYVESIFDISHYGKDAGYGDRAWRYTELDPGASIGHEFGRDDFSWLPTTFAFDVGYMYEQHPRSYDDDTQFVTMEVGLPDVWIEPVFAYEQDIQRDSGSYLFLELGHTFSLIDGDSEDDDPTLSLKPTISQGWGDRRRVDGYLSDENDEPLGKAGLMDTCVKLAAEWNICRYVAITGYVAYYDYLFDRDLKDAAARYEATGHHDTSYTFVCGVALVARF